MKNPLHLVHPGSSKNVFQFVDVPAHLVFEFTDKVSIFDVGAFTTLFTGLGAIRCAIAIRCFEHLRSCGVDTHFVGQFAYNQIIVLGVSIPEKKLTIATSNKQLLPVEILWRKEATKKLVNRVESGSLEIDRLKLSSGTKLLVGLKFDPLFVECSTKWEPADRYLSDEEAVLIMSLRTGDLQRLYAFTRDVANHLATLFEGKFTLQTGKFEIAIDQRGMFTLCDSITPDELELGGFDKNPLRKWYSENHPVWIEQLNKAKKLFPLDKSQWPTYPCDPPKSLIKLMVDNYSKVADAIGC